MTEYNWEAYQSGIILGEGEREDVLVFMCLCAFQDEEEKQNGRAGCTQSEGIGFMLCLYFMISLDEKLGKLMG